MEKGYTDNVGRGDTKTYILLPVHSGSATFHFFKRQEIIVRSILRTK